MMAGINDNDLKKLEQARTIFQHPNEEIIEEIRKKVDETMSSNIGNLGEVLQKELGWINPLLNDYREWEDINKEYIRTYEKLIDAIITLKNLQQSMETHNTEIKNLRNNIINWKAKYITEKKWRFNELPWYAGGVFFMLIVLFGVIYVQKPTYKHEYYINRFMANHESYFGAKKFRQEYFTDFEFRKDVQKEVDHISDSLKNEYKMLMMLPISSGIVK
jgi:hypothetical protein